jgi:hypothetical protein
MPVIPTVGRWKQEDQEFKAILGYIVRPCLKKNQREKTLQERASSSGHLLLLALWS